MLLLTDDCESQPPFRECGRQGFIHFPIKPGAVKIILPNLSNLNFPWSSLLPVYKIVPRSGLANKLRIVVTNSPGIIDSGYQDWVRVSLTNNSKSYHVFTHGSRIAQGLCEMVFDQTGNQSTTNESVFNVTGRTTGGFGSTGV